MIIAASICDGWFDEKWFASYDETTSTRWSPARPQNTRLPGTLQKSSTAMGTVDPTTSVKLAYASRQSGINYIIAPALGRPSAAGNWAMPTGGDAADLERARPVQ